MFIIGGRARKNSEDLIENRFNPRDEFMKNSQVSSLDELIRSNSIDNKIKIPTSAEVSVIDENFDIPKNI